jgi:hypothetical protein
MTDRLQMNLMFDVAAFGILRTKKFPARWQIVKKRAHLDMRAWGFAAVADNFDFAAIDENFCPGDRASFTRSQAESRHTGDTWQRFATKSQCGDGLKVGSRSNFAGGVPLQGKQRVIAVHAAAVIDYANQRNSAAPNNDIDVASACVETVFNQFLYDRRGAFHHFAGRHLAGHGLREQSYPTHLILNITRLAAKAPTTKLQDPVKPQAPTPNKVIVILIPQTREKDL